MINLKPVKHCDPPDWMKAPETLAVMAALNDEPGRALFVGGCIRNHILNKEVLDIDIATQLMPGDVINRMKDAGIKVIPTGVEHGTVTAISGQRYYEITTLRRDVSTDGRRATVAFTEDWAEDARRRDFTMNTLLADGQGNIYDPLGKGLKDLMAKHVVFVGNPSCRIAEDALRLLRFFRFHALYGAGAPDDKALEACTEAAQAVYELSRERITQEVFRILSVDDPAPTLDLMFERGILTRLHFDEYDAKALSALCFFQKRYGLVAMAPRLFALAGYHGDVEAMLSETLLVPKVFFKDIKGMAGVLALPDLTADQTTREAIYRYGRAPVAQALMIELAQDRVNNGDGSAILEIVQNWEVPSLPVNGQDLMDAGVAQGPELGEALSRLEEAWIASDFNLSREALLASL